VSVGPLYQFGGFLNDSGVMVGTSQTGGWIWDAVNGTRSLTSLLPAGREITPVSISQNGRILGQGSFNGGPVQYVEAIPTSSAPGTPAPATGFLVTLGLGMVSAWWFTYKRILS